LQGDVVKVFENYAAAQLRYLANVHAAGNNEVTGDATSPALRALKRALTQATEPALRENLARAIAALEQRAR
jgi:hypothetical protein